MGLVLALGCLLVLPACGKKKVVEQAPATPPPPTYTGPEYLRNTVGSLARLRAGDGEPLLVSGYGIVVFPPGTGTGSSEVPAYLREKLVNEMRKRGIGSARLRAQYPELRPFLSMSPAEFLASRDTAVVEVHGLIPPGAVAGTPFDVRVRALAQTQTTSLAGGTLWTTELAIDGANPAMRFSRPLAEANGPIYLNPFDDRTDAQDSQEQLRSGVVIAGGSVTQPRRLDLVLNQPSWIRSRAIADRINERFGAAPKERIQTANAQTDLLIKLAVPERFSKEPGVLLELIAHLYINRGVNFEQRKARDLVEVLREQPDQARPVMLAWRALGKTIQPVLRDLYEDPDLEMRLSALEAGTWLEDERASRYLQDLAEHPDPSVRTRVAQALVYLPKSLRGSRTLRDLLDDEVRGVRLAAYESLARINDVTVLNRYGIQGPGGELKFIIDQVPAEKPLVYITQEYFPRLVIFGPDLGFDTPTVARLWDNHLMIRAPGPDQAMQVYYQRPEDTAGRTYEAVPTVATLAYLLGHRPSDEDPQTGLDLSYSQVVDAVYHLCRQGHVPAPVEVRESALAQLIDRYENQPIEGVRPETAPDAPPADTTGAQRLSPPEEGLSAAPATQPPTP